MKDTINKLPNNFLQKIKKMYPATYPRICETFLRRKEHTFRINYLKTDLINLRKELNRERVRVKELPWPKGSFILKSELKKLQQTFLYQEGYVYVQNVSSMIPPLILNPQKDEKILDLCAAPGAKTTQIVSLTEGKIELVAVEKVRIRYYKLLANLKVQGAENVTTHLLDGTIVRKRYSEYFDKILLDTSCSAEGLFCINNPRTYKYWKDQKVKEMRHKQKKLLYAAFHALKEDGDLVYSTCTFSPEENEEVIDWALNKFKGTLRVVPIHIPLKNVTTGFRRWQDKKFSPEIHFSVRIMPNSYMEGFFIAHLKKSS